MSLQRLSLRMKFALTVQPGRRADHGSLYLSAARGAHEDPLLQGGLRNLRVEPVER